MDKKTKIWLVVGFLIALSFILLEESFRNNVNLFTNKNIMLIAAISFIMWDVIIWLIDPIISLFKR